MTETISIRAPKELQTCGSCRQTFAMSFAQPRRRLRAKSLSSSAPQCEAPAWRGTQGAQGAGGPCRVGGAPGSGRTFSRRSMSLKKRRLKSASRPEKSTSSRGWTMPSRPKRPRETIEMWMRNQKVPEGLRNTDHGGHGVLSAREGAGTLSEVVAGSSGNTRRTVASPRSSTRSLSACGECGAAISLFRRRRLWSFLSRSP
jgi:hypothetical protein